MTGLLEIDGVLDEPALAALREEMRTGAAEAATVLGVAPGRTALPSARRSARLEIAPATRAALARAIEAHRPRIADGLGRELDELEEPQFLRYGPGDYFVPHQDGNTPLIHDETRFRSVSVVLFVSDPADHEGGELVLHGEAPLPVAAAPGRLVAFPAETTHEVTPIRAGERLTVASWYRASG